MEEEKKITSPIKAIRAYCLECSCGSFAEVKQCPCTECPLYAFRFGKNPYSHRTLTDEQKEAAARRLRNLRSKNDSNSDD